MSDPATFRIESAAPHWAKWEWALLAGAVLAMLALGFYRLAGPSLWHDEALHVVVARALAETGSTTLPSGRFYPSSWTYHALLGAVIQVFGDGETPARGLSVVLGAGSLVVFYVLARRLAGVPAAAVALVLLCTSPWQLAWAQQARPYMMQQTLYLAMMLALWHFATAHRPAAIISYLLVAAGCFGLAASALFHSVLFLAAPIAFAGLAALASRRVVSRHHLLVVAAVLTGTGLMFLLRMTLNEVDQTAVFRTGIGGEMPDPSRFDRFFYLRWLALNHSLGFFLLGLLGTVLLTWRRRWPGLYAALAFWVPVFALTFLVGYRRERFMFFAFPFYLLYCGYALVWLAALAATWRRAWWRTALALLIVAFTLRAGWSAILLARDTLRTASGANLTLAVDHPQWRPACDWVAAHRGDAVILTTTFLPVFYYLGHVDNWFPNRYTWWEYQESGLAGLRSLTELQAYVAAHPRGYFLAAHRRFAFWRKHELLGDLDAEVAWVDANFERIVEASSDSVTVYRWGFAGE